MGTIQIEKIRDALIVLNILLFLLFDLRTYVGGIIPMGIVTTIILFIPLFTFFLCYNRIKISVSLYTIKISDLFFLLCGIFLLCYGIRVFLNLLIDQYEVCIFNNNITYFVYLIFLIMVPILIIRSTKFDKLNLKRILDVSIVLLVASLGKSLIDVLSVISWGEFSTLRFSANDELDTISYGHLGLSLVLISACRMKVAKRFSIFYLFAVAFGLLSMAIANSRSPFFALVAILFFYFACIGKWKYCLIFIIVLICVGLNIAVIDEFFTNELGLTFFERIRIVLETGSDGYGGGTGRNSLYAYGLEMFAAHPLLGSSFVLQGVPAGNGSYVHNIVLEAFMALGICGGTLFVFLNIWGIYCVYRILKYSPIYSVFGLLFLQFFLLGLSSRSLISLPNYWYMLAFVTALYKCTYKK